jgi:D-alanine-D-alanine ligase
MRQYYRPKHKKSFATARAIPCNRFAVKSLLMQIVILHNAVPPDAPPEDQDTLVQAAAVAESLGRLGHAATTLPCTLDLDAMRRGLDRRRPDAVFNLVESLAGADSLVYLPPAVLDAAAIPYAGNRTESLFLTTHKVLAKERMRQAGLPTPAWVQFAATNAENAVADTSHSSWDLRQTELPPRASYILKGVWDQGSRGMDDDAVLNDATPDAVFARLAARAAHAAGPCFAEEFIDGREFNLSLLAGPNGPQAMPPAEIVFVDFPPSKPRIVGHRAKWLEESFEYRHTQRRFDFPASDEPLLRQLQDLALRCWTVFGLRGWARVDFRVDATGRPWILEVNGNPCISHDAGFAAAIARAGISYDTAIARILEDAMRLAICP